MYKSPNPPKKKNRKGNVFDDLLTACINSQIPRKKHRKGNVFDDLLTASINSFFFIQPYRAPSRGGLKSMSLKHVLQLPTLQKVGEEENNS